jgi:hypothetical protein
MFEKFQLDPMQFGESVAIQTQAFSLGHPIKPNRQINFWNRNETVKKSIF